MSTAQVRRVDIIWGAAEARLKPKAGSGPRTEAISHVGAVQRAAAPELERFGKQLSTRQLQRLGEISIQSYGPDPLLYPGVAEQLHVSPRQLKRIQAEESVVRDRYLSSVVGIAKGGRTKPTANAVELQKDSDRAIAKIVRADLTAAQNRELRKLLGKPFSIK